MKHAGRGFTLIELMVVVAIAGILAAIAYPSYQSYIRKVRRADAHAALQSVQLAQERYRTNHMTYAADLTALPNAVARSPDGYYNILIDPGTATGTAYTVRANAVPGTSQAADTGCTSIWIEWSGNAPTYRPLIRCWNK